MGQDLDVVLAGSVTGPADITTAEPVSFAGWDSLVLLSGEPPTASR